MSWGAVFGLILFGLGCGIMLMAWAGKEHELHLVNMRGKMLLEAFHFHYPEMMNGKPDVCECASCVKRRAANNEIERLIESAYTKPKGDT